MMLILKRKRGERVVISYGGKVLAVIDVIETKPGDVCRMGFTALDDVTVDREEKWKEKHQRGCIPPTLGFPNPIGG